MGDLQSEESRDFLLEVKLPVLSSPTADNAVTATLSYFNVINSSFSKCSEILKLDRPGNLIPCHLCLRSIYIHTLIFFFVGADVDPGPPNANVDMQGNRNLVSESLKKARLLADECKCDHLQ